ncbi:MAG: prolyl oligopeptidase family serine peptidase [Lachnospiraceae bacterium]|nr:prolyl oligopeptidase family serine peptidase [Lachnospiraceae bacterium]
MIIWVVGGWGNGIDDFPWTYPEWDNDQTGSAFWQAGVLTMYPSFRGGNGNPGNYEALFGEVDDIASAYEYAASLPYVDPERIYLGGHSTGGTRALLASEYMDKFRAVFCFGAVDEIKYHNNTQFTFDLDNEDEYIMRSPIHWLDDIKSPTFLIEGRDGNSDHLERMEQASQNENIHCYVIEGADHFSTLAPLTRVVAQKILEDTGAECGISIAQEELDGAMKQEPSAPTPTMTARHLEDFGVSFACPYLWEIAENEDGSGLNLYSRYEEENPWDMSALYITAYTSEELTDLQSFGETMKAQGFTVNESSVDGRSAIDATAVSQGNDGMVYYQRYVSIQNGDGYLDFNFITFEDYTEEADLLFQNVIDSIVFDS